MSFLTAALDAVLADHVAFRSEYVRVGRLGYFVYWRAALGGLLLLAVLAVLEYAIPMTPWFQVFLVVLTAAGFVLVLVVTALTKRQDVAVYACDWLYAAEHRRSGELRHGPSPQEALAALDVAIDFYLEEP